MSARGNQNAAKPESVRRSARWHFACLREDHARWRAAAKASGQSLAAFSRRALDAAAVKSEDVGGAALCMAAMFALIAAGDALNQIGGAP